MSNYVPVMSTKRQLQTSPVEAYPDHVDSHDHIDRVSRRDMGKHPLWLRRTVIRQWVHLH